MLKTVLLPNMFVETIINIIFQDSLMNRKFKRTVFMVFGIERNKNNISMSVLSPNSYLLFDQINASLLNKKQINK